MVHRRVRRLGRQLHGGIRRQRGGGALVGDTDHVDETRTEPVDELRALRELLEVDSRQLPHLLVRVLPVPIPLPERHDLLGRELDELVRARADRMRGEVGTFLLYRGGRHHVGLRLVEQGEEGGLDGCLQVDADRGVVHNLHVVDLQEALVEAAGFRLLAVQRAIEAELHRLSVERGAVLERDTLAQGQLDRQLVGKLPCRRQPGLRAPVRSHPYEVVVDQVHPLVPLRARGRRGGEVVDVGTADARHDEVLAVLEDALRVDLRRGAVDARAVVFAPSTAHASANASSACPRRTRTRLPGLVPLACSTNPPRSLCDQSQLDREPPVHSDLPAT